jgi:hypothetical protein
VSRAIPQHFALQLMLVALVFIFSGSGGGLNTRQIFLVGVTGTIALCISKLEP